VSIVSAHFRFLLSEAGFPFPVIHHWFLVPTAQPSARCEQQLDALIRFADCTHMFPILYSGPRDAPKLPPCSAISGPHPIHGPLSSLGCTFQTASRSVHPFLLGSRYCPIDRHTPYRTGNRRFFCHAMNLHSYLI